MIKIAGKVEIVKFKNYTRKLNSSIMIHADFKSILIPANNGKQNPLESYTNKFENHVGCSFGYKLICVQDQFSKLSKTHLGQDAVHKFITNMVEESKYCSRVMRKHFNKELAMTKKDNFESSKNC